jgi:hypothetical protein
MITEDKLPEYLTGGKIPPHMQTDSCAFPSQQVEHQASYHAESSMNVPWLSRVFFNSGIAGAVALITIETRIPAEDQTFAPDRREMAVTVTVFGRKLVEVNMPLADKTPITKPKVIFGKVKELK